MQSDNVNRWFAGKSSRSEAMPRPLIQNDPYRCGKVMHRMGRRCHKFLAIAIVNEDGAATRCPTALDVALMSKS